MTALYNDDYGKFVKLGGISRFRNQLFFKACVRAVGPARRDRILEIGCNDGALLRCLAEHAGEVCGIDVNEAMVQRLRDPRILAMSATELGFDPESFDKVCAFEVLEHIDDLGKVFREVHRVLKVGGAFVLSFPFELIRGQAAWLDSLAVYGDLRHARMLHVHRLMPEKIRRLAGASFDVVDSRLRLLPGPFFFMSLKKVDRRAA
jgi:2-polyprenyl-3-methyl-5-hydroxy-6-metoxy-1,4-benzoquinol methylase